jgi:hypothetical protein
LTLQIILNGISSSFGMLGYINSGIDSTLYQYPSTTSNNRFTTTGTTTTIDSLSNAAADPPITIPNFNTIMDDNAALSAQDMNAIHSQLPQGGRGDLSGFGPSRRVTIGGMNRRSSLGIDPVSMEFFGRRPSGFGDLDMGPMGSMLGRRDSLDSTTAVLDAAIMDLTRRRLSMAVGPMPGEVNIGGGMGDPLASMSGMNAMNSMNAMNNMNSMNGLSMNLNMNSMAGMNAMASMGNQLKSLNATSTGVGASSMGGGGHGSSGGGGGNSGNNIASRQQQLQEQQRELERRQKELEVQRQQLVAGMEERRMAMQQMQQQISGGYGGGGVASSLLMGGGGGQGLSGLGGGGGGPQGNNGQQWWICQICNTKAFASREEALQHESICTAVPGGALARRSSLVAGHRGSLGLGGLFNHRGSLSFLSDLARSDPQGGPTSQSHFAAAGLGGMDSVFGSGDTGDFGRRFSLSQGAGGDMSIGNNNNNEAITTKMSTGPFAMMPAPLPLAMVCDKDWLTPLHCFVRRHCVEVFTATHKDVATPSKGKRKPIQVGQVGIRCPHCHHDESTKARERGSVYYPTTIASIYNATMNLLQRHLHNCSSVPEDIMRRYETLKADDARSGTSKKYWVESALSLGVVDTPNGIRFSALTPPPLPGLSRQQTTTGTSSTARRNSNDFFSSSSNAISDLSQRSSGANSIGASGGSMGGRKPDSQKTGVAIKSDLAADAAILDKHPNAAGMPGEEQNLVESAPLVSPEDEAFSTGFSFHLLSQMQPCVFTDADRLGKRKGLPPGFPGLACRHCFGGYGSGRFFPSSIKTLSDTSKTLNVLHNHMMRCRKCPPGVRENLEKLRATHDEERAKMKFGSQKAFFARIWDCLHKNDAIIRKSGSAAAKRKLQLQQQQQEGNALAAANAAAMGGYQGNLSSLKALAMQQGVAKRRRVG